MSLFDVVKEHWPQAEEITPSEVLIWADQAKTQDQKLARFMSVAMAIQYPNGVWYRFPPALVSGYRFGENGPDYLSGFDVI